MLVLVSFSVSPGTLYSGPWFIEYKNLVEYISDKYNKPPEKIYEVVRLALIASSNIEGRFPTTFDVLAVIAVESGFNSKARHESGPSVGLMQINLGFHKISNPLSLKSNIQKGVGILTEYSRMSSSLPQTLISYNAGPYAAKRICVVPQKCKSPYVKKVLRLRSEFLSVHFNGDLYRSERKG
jgi:hypothetical protein